MLKIIKKNLLTLCIFEFIFNITLSLIVVPILKQGFYFSMKLRGISYLTQDNMLNYLMNPFIILFLLINAFIVTLATIYDINAILITYTFSKNNKKIGTIELAKITFNESSFLREWKNIPLFLYCVLLLPLVGIVYRNPIINRIRIPDFIIEGIDEYKVLMLFLVLILLTIYTIHRMFVFSYILFEKISYKKATKKSVEMFKKNRWKLFKKALIAVLVAGTSSFIVFVMNTISIVVIVSIKNVIFYYIASTLLLIINVIIGTIFSLIVKVYYIYIINEVFFCGKKLPEYEYENIVIKKYRRLIDGGIIAISIIIAVSSIMINRMTSVETDMAVMAHRGSAMRAVENTKDAFLLAIKENAKYIELDVVLSKDKEVVISHDLSFYRLSGIKGRIKEKNWMEIKKLVLDDGTYKGKPMLLKNLLPLIPENVILNIEMKPDNNVYELAKEVESVISKYPRHMVCSLNLDCLRAINDINPKRETCYIMAIALGDYKDIDFVDIYSIESSFVSEKVVKDIHHLGKKIFVWTVNDETTIGNYYYIGVDGVITDYPLEMNKEILVAKSDYDFIKLGKLFSTRLE